MTSALPRLEHLLRELAPQVLQGVVRRHGDFDAAEDAVQESLIAAARHWPVEGIPDNPRGWLYTAALRRITDHLRSEVARTRRQESAAAMMLVESLVTEPDDDPGNADHDDTLSLFFRCCHPSLTPTSAMALTLRAVGGLTTAEIATAFMVPEATMAQRISRAKKAIPRDQAAFAPPSGEEFVARLDTVLHTLYLVFNEGYVGTSGPSLQRVELSLEAIRLTRSVTKLVPGHAEARGLLALMLLTDARRHARTGPHGELIPLDEQDRSRWDRKQITEGTALVAAAMSRGSAGPYLIQAAIAAEHDRAPSVADTDWPAVVGWYDRMLELGDNPMVRLNHAIAVAMVEGPVRGLELVAQLDGDKRTAGHYRLDAVRGHLYQRMGDLDRARAYFGAAAAGTSSSPERDYLLRKAAEAG